MSSTVPSPEKPAPGVVHRCLGAGFRAVREAPLSAVWMSVFMVLPLAGLTRWSSQFGWMIALVVLPVFVAGPLRLFALRAASLPAGPLKAFDPWYAASVRNRLLTLGGFMATAGIVAFGIGLSILGGSAVLLAESGGSQATLIFGEALLVVLVLVTALVCAAGFLYAIPLVHGHGLGPLDAISASVAACRRDLALAVQLLLVLLACVLLAVPTLGLSLLLGLPLFLAAVDAASRELFPGDGA